MTLPPMPPGADDERPSEPRPETAPDVPAPGLPGWARQRPNADVPSEAVMADYIGPKWDRVYRRKLAPFLEDPSFVPTWNWSAALAFPPAWFLYRKLYLPFAIFFLLPGLAFRVLTGTDKTLTVQALQQPENEFLLVMNAAIFVSTVIASGGTANWFLFRRARAANRLIVQQQLPAAEAERFLRRVGGTNRMATALFVAFSLMLAVATIGG